MFDLQCLADSVPIEWLILDELTDEYAIFKIWPTEQNRIAATHLMEMPDLKWEKVEGQSINPFSVVGVARVRK